VAAKWLPEQVAAKWLQVADISKIKLRTFCAHNAIAFQHVSTTYQCHQL
jgi:GrpB-like predicted nucleotidyltransferase (UPF0157 family)